ncbi:MAG: SPOR domain-containing protein [Trueperaceae bacterium]|nr:SPOR domain-containing protein [Trueperaceae bacterium]MCC6309787.1 SPOR domain-containing protein [Trueperaceae bacterium]MCO5172793.1 SPOR domain-containing protein [Trueperaceae bacterium]MCW5819763.1 SPOR domain-containing protein [Trueperaceae bacterium]
MPRQAGIIAPLVVVCAALIGLASAQSIAYTVQVLALSDRDAALGVMGDLQRQGYPAYVTRSTSAQGDVFRVRVGAFVNRPAAVNYAEAMPSVSGGRPVPALAESIPAGITPLAPRLLLEEDVSGMEARLLAFPDGSLVLRLQWRVPLAQAEYVVIQGGEVERVRAWRLAEGPGGERLRVRELPLWPDTWQQDSPEVRQAFAANLVALVAERIGVRASEVDAARYRPQGDEVPRLFVVERVPAGGDAPELLGVGLPASGVTAAGPIAYLGIDPTRLPGLPEGARVDLASGSVIGDLAVVPWPLGEPGAEPGAEAADDAAEQATLETVEGATAESEGSAVGAEGTGAGADGDGAAGDESAAAGTAAGAVVGDGWVASPDGEFVRLTAVDASTGATVSWRAGVGTPVWSDGRRLLALRSGKLLVYDFLLR